MYLITGGAGFIGSALVHALVGESVPVVNVDKLTYAANPASLAELEHHPAYHFERVDIADAASLRELFLRYRPDAVIHLAAESHVDRSIDAPDDFIRTNLVGTFTLLSEARRFFESLPGETAARFRVLHASTDEVFGSRDDGRFHEWAPYRPSSPYAATKAGADHLARAWHRTYGLPVIVTYASNTFGPRQFPEKLIPLAVLNALARRPIDVYGDGTNIRDWLHVDDHVDGLLTVLARGTTGSAYAIGGGNERANLDVVLAICDAVDSLDPSPDHPPRRSLVRFVADRPGHDFRYALDTTRMTSDLGWQPRRSFAPALVETVRWYIDHRAWWEPLLDDRVPAVRRGLGSRG